MITVLVALAGGLGAGARFVVDAVVRARLGGRFPWGTLVINVGGSLLLGLLAGLVLGGTAPADLRAVAGTGFCGGYTTFSTASVEAVRLARSADTPLAVAYAAGTLLLTLAAAGLGLAAGLAV